MAYMDPESFEERSALCGKPQDCAILLWNIGNAMKPQRALISESETTAFQYNPCDKRLLAGGTFSGQVVFQYKLCFHHMDASSQVLMWEIESGRKESSDETRTNTCRYSFASALDATGSSPVTDLKWLPGCELTKNGVLSSLEVRSIELQHLSISNSCSRQPTSSASCLSLVLVMAAFSSGTPEWRRH